jgi:hypothetical protein
MSGTPELREKLRSGYKPLLSLLAQAINRANDIPLTEAKTLATLIMSTIDGIWLHSNFNVINDYQLRKMARQLLRVVLQQDADSTLREKTRQSTG